MSPDVLSQLRSYADQLDAQAASYEEVAAPPTAVRRGEEPRQRRSRRGWAIAIAAAVVTTLIIAVPLLLLGGEADDAPVVTQPAPDPTLPPLTTEASATTNGTATTEASATTTPEPPLPTAIAMTWERIPDQEVFNDAFVAAVVPGGPGLVAVGYVSDPVGPDPLDWDTDAAVWVSGDGLSWDRVDDPSLPTGGQNDEGSAALYGQRLGDLAAGPLGLLAVGNDRSTSLLLISSDGINWSRVEDDDLAGVSINAATAAGPGWVAVGSDGTSGDAVVLISEDGLNWDRIESGALAGGVGSDALDMFDVAAGGSGLVAIGRVGFDGLGTRSGSAVVWVSADGREWERLPPDTIAADRLVSVAVDPASGSLVAFGHAVWVSNDGRQWEPTFSDQLPPVGSAAAWEGDRIVAAGYHSFLPWVSPDRGTTWYGLDSAASAFAGMDWPWVTDITRFEDRFVAVGGDEGAAATVTAAVWIVDWTD